MLTWPVAFVGVLLMLFGVGSAYQSYSRNATAPLERRSTGFGSIFPGMVFALAGLIVLVVVTVRLVAA